MDSTVVCTHKVKQYLEDLVVSHDSDGGPISSGGGAMISSLLNEVHRLAECVPSEAVVCGLIYLTRTIHQMPMHAMDLVPAVVASLLLAVKFLYDETRPGNFGIFSSHIGAVALRTHEAAMLHRLHWRLFVSDDEFGAAARQLLVAARPSSLPSTCLPLALLPVHDYRHAAHHAAMGVYPPHVTPYAAAPPPPPAAYAIPSPPLLAGHAPLAPPAPYGLAAPSPLHVAGVSAGDGMEPSMVLNTPPQSLKPVPCGPVEVAMPCGPVDVVGVAPAPLMPADGAVPYKHVYGYLHPVAAAPPPQQQQLVAAHPHLGVQPLPCGPVEVAVAPPPVLYASVPGPMGAVVVFPPPPLHPSAFVHPPPPPQQQQQYGYMPVPADMGIFARTPSPPAPPLPPPPHLTTKHVNATNVDFNTWPSAVFTYSQGPAMG